MKINFLELEAENFQSFEKLHLKFEMGKTIILGENRSTDSSSSNGSGKSSIFDALIFGLYKKSLRDKDVSMNYKGNCRVKVTFAQGETVYAVERFLKHKVNKNDVKLYINGEDITYRKSSFIEDEILKVIGISPDVFMSSVVVLQGLPMNFSSYTPTLRKTIIEELVGACVWEDYRKQFNLSSKKVSTNMSNLQVKFDTARTEIVSLETKITTIQRIKEQDTQGLEIEEEKIKSSIEEIILKIKKIREEYIKNSSDLYSEVKTLSNSYNLFKQRINTLNSIIEKQECPECGQPYPESQRKQAQIEYNNVVTKLEKLKPMMAQLDSDYTNQKAREHQVSLLEQEKQLISKQLYTVQQKKNNKVDEDSTQYLKQLQELKNSFLDVKEEINYYSSIVEAYDYIDKLLLPSSAFRTMVLSKYIEYINSLLDEVTPLIFPEVELKLITDSKATGVDFSTIKNKIEVNYKSLSGGERRRLDICMILATQRFLIESAGVSTNLLVFDEIFDSLDAKGIESVLNCIDSLFPDSTCQYIISHNDSLKFMFNNILKVIKENNISFLENTIVN